MIENTNLNLAPKPSPTTDWKKVIVVTVIVSFFVSSLTGGILGFIGGALSSKILLPALQNVIPNLPILSPIGPTEPVKVVKEESAIIEAVKKTSPAVVSIIVTKDLPKIERYFYNPFGDDFFGEEFTIPGYRQQGTEKREIGGGTGFIVSTDGLIVTNKHVVEDTKAEYTVLTNDGQKIPAEVLARDPSNDLAIIKIDPAKFIKPAGVQDLPTVELGDSANLQVGQTVITIGNALGEFRNTVSVGVISGLMRSITAGDGGGKVEQLSGVIQTDAAINPGNSGGPLLNIEGQVIGVNVAMATTAENIGFAIPINDVKKIIQDVKTKGKIVRPFLGVRYVLLNKEIAEKNNLAVDYGALVLRGENPTDLAVLPGSPADKAGIVENDIILEMNGVKIDEKNPLSNQISKFNAGDQITLKILHRGEAKEVKVKLEEKK